MPGSYRAVATTQRISDTPHYGRAKTKRLGISGPLVFLLPLSSFCGLEPDDLLGGLLPFSFFLVFPFGCSLSESAGQSA